MKGFWKSVAHVLKDLPASNIVSVETKVVNPELGYCGTFDCLAMFRVRSLLCSFSATA